MKPPRRHREGHRIDRIGWLRAAVVGANDASDDRDQRHHPPPMSRPKPFSMIREFHLADWFTLGNALCGVGALFAAMSYLQTREVLHIYFACALIPVALVFDVLDGRIARWRQRALAMGRELDSLADVISFGVAPAAIAYGCGMQGLFDRIVLVFFVACGVSRLARYNVTTEELSEGGDKVKFFEGTPIPTSLVLVLGLAIAAAQGALGDQLWFGVVELAGFKLHPLVLLFAVSGSLMVSRIRIPSPSASMSAPRKMKISGVLLAVVSVAIALAGCVATKYEKAAQDTPPPVPLNLVAAQPPIELALRTVIVYNGPGSWKREALWDEYVVTIHNRGAKPLTIAASALVDFTGASHAPGVDPWTLEKESQTLEQRYQRAGVAFSRSRHSCCRKRGRATGVLRRHIEREPFEQDRRHGRIHAASPTSSANDRGWRTAHRQLLFSDGAQSAVAEPAVVEWHRPR
jgi:CDP-diacylglycerol--serine O-phosphatidyltransferase